MGKVDTIFGTEGVEMFWFLSHLLSFYDLLG